MKIFDLDGRTFFATTADIVAAAGNIWNDKHNLPDLAKKMQEARGKAASSDKKILISDVIQVLIDYYPKLVKHHLDDIFIILSGIYQDDYSGISGARRMVNDVKNLKDDPDLIDFLSGLLPGESTESASVRLEDTPEDSEEDL